jgi:hypothetical protein
MSEEQQVIFRHFVDRLGKQAASDTINLIFEVSILMLAVTIMLYLQGKSTSLKIEPVPSFIIFVLTSAYIFFKLVWYIYVLLRFHQEKTVIIVFNIILIIVNQQKVRAGIDFRYQKKYAFMHLFIRG